MAEENENKVADFVNKVVDGDNAAAGEAFKDALKGKVGSALDQQRIDVAGNLFNTAAISDPKPNVADPAPTTSQVIGTEGDDITQQVAPETPEQPVEAPADNVESQ